MARAKGSKNKVYKQGDYIKGDGKHIPPGKNTVPISVDTSGFGRLMVSLGETVSEAIRPAVQAGTQVIYDQVIANVESIGRKTGNLRDSIYQVYSKKNSEEGVSAEYHVSWNARKAPHGRLVEYGHIMSYRTILATKGKYKGQWVTLKKQPLAQPKQVGARPFLRPAAYERKTECVAAIEGVLVEYLGEIS